MRNIKSTVILASILMLAMIAQAADPLDAITSKVSEQISVAPQNLTQKAVEHILEGNLTKEHIQQDINATGEQLKQKATEKIKQEVNNTTEQIQQKAKEEIDKQVNQRLGQPGFELAFAMAGILVIAYLLRRRD